MVSLVRALLAVSLLSLVPACSGSEFTSGGDSDASIGGGAGAAGAAGSSGTAGAGGTKPDASTDAADASQDAKESGADVVISEAGIDVAVIGCGDLICAPDENCLTCPSDCACAQGVCFSGKCCVPECGEKKCGPDSCGGSCGDCGTGSICQEGVCVAQSSCGNGQCDPSAGETCWTCGNDCKCADTQTCMVTGQCCEPACGTKTCGFDNCGGVCGGLCMSKQACINGACVPSDTCGNNSCDPGETCDNCVWDCLCPTGTHCVAGGTCQP